MAGLASDRFRLPLLAAGLFLIACGSAGDGAGPTAPPSPTAGTCVSPLAAFCEGSACPRFADALAILRRDVQRGWCLRTPLGYYGAKVGRCGDLGLVNRSHPLGGITQIFGADGTLVAVVLSSDTANRNCADPVFGAFYGSPPECATWAMTDLCEAR
jgi:hypothetical protein